jgi:hypothetical protein
MAGYNIRIAETGSMDNTPKTNRFSNPQMRAGEGGIQAVSEEDLVNWLTAQFQSYPGCAQVSVVRVTRLELPDSEGCNWSRTLVLDPAGAQPSDYVLAYAAAVEKGRKRFNLAVRPGDESPADEEEHGIR